MTKRNDSIIEKIKGLLALANDQQNDEECQTAFMMAQKLMIKYDISSSELEEGENDRAVSEGQATAHKTLYWWERQLANIITRNFRVTWYYNNKIIKGETKKKRAIMFMGFESDVALAKEMYVLAYDVLSFYVQKFVNDYYDSTQIYRTKKLTTELKNSYTTGFLNGLKEKFEEQVKAMEQEYGLMVLLPAEVKQEYDKRFGHKKGLSYKIPPIEEIAAYQKGFQDGNKVDYTKSTLDKETSLF
ncbi:DUF2786 domain-containing protein [Lysinibacillus pakistanensis]|uniref:DUF2786 domain-containing protein n=1 Tax=Lysinibacillus pakistanensis TaxID=759811 RepID=A0AAX3X1B2_9BACI|nr:DUF2786 domain-containing protein [Lysinibacillus pakistanensis]MDM5233349.1 DUF2786 domain-containing protein [Lysinibacillus pakistanensis]WHY48823.1 DUF2786 domain-containing protein [Lysinibacillus pakistanensis]WHY53835.1 DUF2786 domain-containing protein [Lysinibacillus pakistanensis]